MAKTTRATQFLDKAGVAYTTATYDYDPNAERIGLQAAEAIGEHPSRVLKTLMAELDGKPVCVVVPSDKEVSMKKLASAFGGKSAAMMKPASAEKLTGFVVGGISPFGQKRMLSTVIDESAVLHTTIFVSGGRRGLDIEVGAVDLIAALHATLGAIATAND